MQRTKITLPPHTLSTVRYEMWKHEVDRKSDYLNQILKDIKDGKYDEFEVGPKRESQAIYVNKELVEEVKPVAEEKGFKNLTHMVINVIDSKETEINNVKETQCAVDLFDNTQK